jgi:DnaJ-class molecular chaperone
VELALAKDERFVVEGSSLQHELSLPLDVALLGGEVTVPTPEGQVRLTIPARAGSGKRLRIPGKGIYARGAKRGDLFVKVEVAMPDAADSELEAAVRSWRERRERRAS